MSILAHGLRAAAGNTGGGVNIAEFSYITSDSQDRPSSSAEFTFSSINIGAADDFRTVVVCVGGFRASAILGDITSVTIGGVSAVYLLTPFNGGAMLASIWAAVVPTGTTATIVVNHGNATTCGISVYRVVTQTSNIPTVPASVLQFFNASGTVGDNRNTPTTTSPTTGSINAENNSAVIALSYGINTINPTWTGLTQDTEIDTRSNEWFSTASEFYTSAQTVNYSVTNANNITFIVLTVCLQ